ncbi:MAG: DUF4124 domain-containing protein [Desulfobacterales bacterium]
MDISQQFPESLILVEKIYRFVYKRIIALPNSPIRNDQRPFFYQGPADKYFRNGESKMKPLIMLTIVGVILSIWCSTAHADKLYTWEDDKGVTHITKEPPPQKTKLKDTMDYTVPPAQKNQATGKQVLNEGESSQPQRSEARERKKVSGAKEETEEVDEETGEVDEDVYYDSDGGRYTRRAIRQERKEARENRREDVRPATRERRQFHRRK